MKDLVIIGAGGFGREVKSVVDDINKQEPTWNFLGFIDDDTEKIVPEGDPIIGNLDFLCAMDKKPYAVITIAKASIREAMAHKCEEAGVPFATIIDPTVKLRANNITIGEGSILCPECSLSVNCHLGKHCIINKYCSMGHDTVLDDYVSMMSRTMLAGEVNVGKACYFGLRCTVINLINITDHCTFGACACLVKDATVSGTYVGVPAKMIKEYNPEA